jgi:hypothetical protein
VSQTVLTGKNPPPTPECVYEMTYCVGRRKRDPVDDGDGEYTYEIWITAEPRPAQIAPARSSDPPVKAELGPESGGALDDLKQAIEAVAAGRVEGMAWKIDDLSERGAARLIGMPGRLRVLAGEPLDTLARAAGVPAPAASFSGDVASSMLLKPILAPVDSALRDLEIVGAVIGLLTGLHWLSVTCVKRLVHRELGSALTRAFDRVIRRTRRSPPLQRIGRASPPYRREPEEPQRPAPQAVPRPPRRAASGTAASRRGRPSKGNLLPPAAAKEPRSRDTAARDSHAHHQGTVSRPSPGARGG